MSDEDLLRGALQTLASDQPAAPDRVGAVQVRVRRRARQRTAGGALAAVVLLSGALLVLPSGQDERVSTPAVRGQDRAPLDYRLTITQALVAGLPGTIEQRVATVSAALQEVPRLPNRIVRNRGDDAELLAGDPLTVRVDFVRRLTGQERGRVQASLSGLPGDKAVQVADVPGFELELAAVMSPGVRAELARLGTTIPSAGDGPLARALGGSFSSATDPSGAELVVLYTGPAFSSERLETARREVARLAGVDPAQVRVGRTRERFRELGLR